VNLSGRGDKDLEIVESHKDPEIVKSHKDPEIGKSFVP
jgi:hypothetical protein